ncbi:MAG: hypothetical protein KDE04_15575 [Anaerolineales bacterium]|nr:hypothetical protein [Anaerolineales bacterium]MCB0031500.1 hypothetical protein [Anaerolineales bacterium]
MTEQSASSPHDSEKEEHRQYTLSITEADRQKSFDTEDARWSRAQQTRDWSILGVMILIMLIWQFLVYWLEPGLR